MNTKMLCVCLLLFIYSMIYSGKVQFQCSVGFIWLLLFVHMLKIHTYLIICINREHMQISRLKNISIKY